MNIKIIGEDFEKDNKELRKINQKILFGCILATIIMYAPIGCSLIKDKSKETENKIKPTEQQHNEKTNEYLNEYILSESVIII